MQASTLQVGRRAQPDLVRRTHPLRAPVHGQPRTGRWRAGSRVLALLLALAVSVAMSLRKGRIPGTAAGPSRRIIGITIISFLAMMFTPTKWTHHFGVFAGLAGSLGALAAVAVTRCGDALAAQPHDVRRRGAVRDRAVVRQRQRLVVRVQLRCAVVELRSRSGTSASPPSCSGCRCWRCWWRRGSTSPAATAGTTRTAERGLAADLCSRRWRLRRGRWSSSRWSR